ncbi:E3 ubiquitin-protein ligase MBR2-like isoform X2 [Cynara cardunculus var. scolymus]|uniref:E3 ubiquitin-protein ligase MBR2-like isoform X2 n=1 Tax=Cynara cardunculus var. scolymus TaxID=59895 RepID=UPI000D62D6C9|nr:E3 ubiquitin-protein ligase MBR2-like isoform X2 [Cynara cardunculus var. scolymus]
MQGRRGIFDTFPETVDLNQGPNSNSRGINESDECNNSLSPTERRLLSDDLSDLNLGYGGNNSNDGGHRMGFMNLYKSGSSEMEASSSSNGIGTSSECGTEASFGNWGLSCKRKALEGTSGEFFGSGSSSYFPETENIVWHTRPNGNSGSSSLSASSSMLNSQEHINSITGVGVRDSSSFTISQAGNPGRFSNGGSSHQSSRRFLHNEFLDQTSKRPISMSANPNHPLNLQPPRNVLPFPWGDNVNSRNGSSSSSELPPESGSRNNEQHRNLVQDSANWSLASGRASTSGANAASGSHPSNAVWMPHFNSTTQGQQRLPEFSPWTLFPSSEAESVGHRGRFSPFPMGSSSNSEENVLSSGVNSQGRHHRPFLRPAPLMEVPNDEWQAFTADIEGRHRLVSEMRQILNALQRGENLRAEDYVLFDPFINGVAELHDRHRDMRLDVDNMSYEELLALEERIGDVKTGLKEEVILKSMKQRKHVSTSNLEPCCICREEYERGDDIGSLECGHDFHTICIKEWLANKNVCPICKTTALSI